MIARLAALMLFVATAHAATAPVPGSTTHALQSGVLKEERSYQVFVPNSYGWARDRKYPVLYVLDGIDHFAHSAASVDYLARHGEIPEMIVVALASTVRVRDFTQTDWPEMWVGGGGAANFKRFLATELIPDVERRYRTDGFRALSGHSAGGQFVLHCLASAPEMFKGYIALSPSLDWDKGLPQRELQKSFAARKRLDGFIYVARSDDSGEALAQFDALVATLKTKAPAGLRWHDAAYPDETHESIALLAQVDALRRLWGGYRFHNDLMDKGLAYAEQHFRKVSQTVGTTIALPEHVLNNFAYAELSQGKIDAAIALFERNVAANPNSAYAYDGLADGHAEAGRWAQAVKASQRALELTAPDDPNRAYFDGQLQKMQLQLERAQMQR